MSVTNCFKGCESNCDCKNIGPVTENSLNKNDVVKKFESYRSKVEQIQAEYKEAKLVIDRLKEEINLNRDMEKYNSLEISSLKSEIKVLEEKKKSFFLVSEKQRAIQKALQKHDENIMEIKNVIREVKENLKTKISTASKELELIQENRYFQSALQCTEDTLELVKNEMKNALKEKEELIQQYVSSNNLLSEELENLKSERDDIKDAYNKTVESYKKQIDEYEAIIKKLEQERKRMFGDYEICATPQKNHKSTSTNCEYDEEIFQSRGESMTRFFDERRNISTEESMSQKTSENFSSQTHSMKLNFPKDTDFHIKQNSFQEYLTKTTKSGLKQKPKIEFIDSGEPLIKRRLYSDNDNSYLN